MDLRAYLLSLLWIRFLETLRNIESTHSNFDVHKYFQTNRNKQLTVKKMDLNWKINFLAPKNK